MFEIIPFDVVDVAVVEDVVLSSSVEGEQLLL